MHYTSTTTKTTNLSPTRNCTHLHRLITFSTDENHIRDLLLTTATTIIPPTSIHCNINFSPYHIDAYDTTHPAQSLTSGYLHCQFILTTNNSSLYFSSPYEHSDLSFIPSPFVSRDFIFLPHQLPTVSPSILLSI